LLVSVFSGVALFLSAIGLYGIHHGPVTGPDRFDHDRHPWFETRHSKGRSHPGGGA
jgi:hypothetical protein